jgi:glycosyltransferase involved in cell wall biosynthesis
MQPARPITNEEVPELTKTKFPAEPKLSIVIPISERFDDLRQVYFQYAREISSSGLAHEFIFVVDGADRDVLEILQPLKDEYPGIVVITLGRMFGEATALAAGFEVAKGETIITVPAYFQVEPSEIRRMLERFLEQEQDLIIAWRYPRIDSRFNRLQSRVFNGLMRLLIGTNYQDISCGLRVMKRHVAQEIRLYGDLHRFLPLLAHQRGFKIAEIPVQQSPHDVKKRVYGPGVYLRRLLDILTLFFLYKFTRKPLRFFGLIGSGVFCAGAILTAYLGIDRFLGVPLASRPLLILGVLWMVFGIQLFSIGLLGEIIIFTHAREVKDYQIKEIVERQSA